ncbi:MAG: hydroxymethylglutaryl-CoA lyase [Albidovulum sp.]|nr:hydroxymethylglutaryl-CoA lyase [Albidovulum sp.]
MKVGDLYPEGRVSLRELGLRDGLQLTSTWPATADKMEWIEREFDAGIRHFEVGSFLPKSRYPQFADISQLIERIGLLPSAKSSALTMNERAVRDALNTQVDEIVLVVSSTEEHSLANIRRGRQASIDLVRHARIERDAANSMPVVNTAISMAFGCSISGQVDPQEVTGIAVACVEAGAEVIGLADTVGFAGPRQVRRLVQEIRRALPGIPLIIHLHDTRGTGIANAAAALDEGVRILDGTLGGLGGCPFAPGATGNVAIEDLVFLCERQGFDTGIDLEALIDVRVVLARSMPGEKLHGSLARAGAPKKVSWRARDSANSAALL